MTKGFWRHAALALFLAAVAWAIWSYSNGGVVRALFASDLDTLREVLARWGRLAPAVYVAAVVLEVLLAPIPGTLLYAPAGALFGGLLGGTLSLTGNVIGAAIACGVGGAFGEHALARRLQRPDLARYRDAIQQRGIWVVMLLRVNPLTSSDIVSYVAGAVGVPVWRVALGTLLGMAPLCYAQAFLAEQIFDMLPGAVYILLAAGLVYALLIVIWISRRPAAGASTNRDKAEVVSTDDNR